MQSKRPRSISSAAGLLIFVFLGTAFCLRASGQTLSYSFAALVNFNGRNGGGPNAPLLRASDGNLYGTTVVGVAIGYGTVFSITTQGRSHTVYSFCAKPNCADGSNPYGGVVQGPDGNFYGTTYFGGSYNDGVLFKLIAQH